MREIERKFRLLRPAAEIIQEAHAAGALLGGKYVQQRYLPNHGEWVTRLRRTVEKKNVRFFLTMKLRGDGIACDEPETEVTADFYMALGAHCGPTLTKRRSRILFDGREWEVDVFHNPELNGLELAEIELTAEDERFGLPPWAGEEVSRDPAFRNENLTARLGADALPIIGRPS